MLFFASPEVSGSLTPSTSNVRTPPLDSTPPIVLVVFDEFPVHSLLDADGRIDQVRFPHFAALAREASWFRETTTVSSQTVWAVPAIVSAAIRSRPTPCRRCATTRKTSLHCSPIPGAIVDGIAESVGILPTIADVLGMRLPFQVDGRSLVGDGLPVRATRTFIDRSVKRAARRISRFGVGSYDAVYAVPGTSELLGQSPAAFAGRAGTLRVKLATPEVFADVNTASDTLPLHVRGRVFGRVTQPFAVVVNGRIAATTRMYQESGASVFGTMISEGVLRPGRNEIAIFLVDRTGGTTTLVSTLQ